jgi:hypothetical protein
LGGCGGSFDIHGLRQASLSYVAFYNMFDRILHGVLHGLFIAQYLLRNLTWRLRDLTGSRESGRDAGRRQGCELTVLASINQKLTLVVNPD